jgi:hypothetical protein
VPPWANLWCGVRPMIRAFRCMIATCRSISRLLKKSVASAVEA